MKDRDFNLLLVIGGVLLIYHLLGHEQRLAYAAKKAKKKAGGAAGAKGGGAGGTKFTQRGKTRVLKAPKVQLIFWGNWANASPSTTQIDGQFRSLIGSSFFDKLAQYGGGKPTYLGSINYSPQPTNGYSDAQIIAAIGALIKAGKTPDMAKDPDMIYCLLPPKGVKAADKEGDAYHIDFGLGGARANLMTYYGNYNLVSMMRALSEEIAETIVDPWQTGNGDQIGDVCENVFVVNGVTVEGYWSNSDNKCT
jgi:hypothetical protein